MTLSNQVTTSCYSEFRRINLTGNVFLFTSALSNEGKTYIISHLAIAQALKLGQKKPILFMDLNSFNQKGGAIFMESNSIHSTDQGIVDVLLGQAKLKDCIFPTKVPRLFVLPFGRGSDNFEPLQHLRKLQLLLKKLRQHFTIFIDTCPVFLRNRRNFDPAEISPLADQVCLIVLSGKTPREVIKQCVTEIESCGGKIGGVIMNDLYVVPFRSELSRYLSWLEWFFFIRKPIFYLRQRLGIY